MSNQISVAVIGNPNVGKSLVFNQLTGAAQTVGNWCGTTTDSCTRVVEYNERHLAFTDLPGTYGIDVGFSQDQTVINEFLSEHVPDVMLVVVDAFTLERNLYLVIELLERFNKVIVLLNKLDIAENHGLSLNIKAIESHLKVPVIPIVASSRIKTHEIYKLIASVNDSNTVYGSCIEYPHTVERAIRETQNVLSTNRKEQADRWMILQQIMRTDDDLQLEIIGARYDLAAKIAHDAITKTKNIKSLSEKVDEWVLHPYYGLPIMIIVFSIMFYLTFTVSKPLSELIGGWFDLFSEIVDQIFQTVGITNIWTSLITDGIIKGVGATMGFLPQMIAFFLVYTILQDTGYIVRVAFLMDKLMRAIGLSGKTFLPIIVGCSCNVNGILASRILTSKYDHIVAILVSSYVPCSARLGVLVFLVSAFFASGHATMVMLGLLGLDILLMALTAYVVGFFVPRDDDAAFMMEVPVFQWPNMQNLVATTAAKTLHFLARIKNVIIYSAVIMWFLSSFPQGPFEGTYIAKFGKFLEPFGNVIGLNWQLIVALLLGIAAKETTLTALGIMYHAAEEQGSLPEVLINNIDPLVAFTFLVVYMIYTPCIPTLVTIYQETKDWRLVVISVLTNLGLALILGGLIFNIGKLTF